MIGWATKDEAAFVPSRDWGGIIALALAVTTALTFAAPLFGRRVLSL